MKKINIVVITLVSVLCFMLFIYYIPSLNLKDDEVIMLLNEEYKEPGYNLKVLYYDLSSRVKETNNIDNTKIGDYVVLYQYNYLFNHYKYRRVHVTEKIPPVLTLNGQSEVNVCPNKKYEEEGYTSIDNYDGDITDRVNVDVKDNEIIYTSIDKSNNTSSVTRKINYIDESIPSISLNGNSNIYLHVGDKYEEPGYTASDDCLGDITSNVTIDSNVDTSKNGNYTITYTVSDGYNEISVKRNVYVTERYKYVVSSTSNGVVYLTFDDGPNPTYTPYILNILKKYDAKATFFIVPKGNTTNYLISREYNEGHTVGIHSYSHVYSTIYASDDSLYNDIFMVNDKIKKITGQYSYIYRYPGGSSNTVAKKYNPGVISRSASTLELMGYHYFDWNISSGDASNVTPSSSTIASNVINHLSKSRINVVLMHDIKHNTAYAIESILQYGLSHGYRFEAINLSTPVVHHTISN